MSQAGYSALRFNEGVVMRYYNDAPKHGNCTWGIGTLAYLGPCTQEELARTVLPEQANAVLQSRVRDAELAVKAVVTQHELTQAQFDAAVSFAYNSSRQNTVDALTPANTGNMKAVAAKMMLNVMITPRDSSGRRVGPARASGGLRNRRQRESAPFLQVGQ
ncbi:glycoside hydrolase family protein [Paraburkholderia bryophila]|uniref:Lysozyme n=1 Tax=Paraburkholderia bryophila TaxID=420952 RepID=A0A7Y9WPW4_9BURK|nr:glycoside hydrolase family protein [Paraburkholderia bryophila]NYH24969.1 GH24 family phage-related lysozyme (muramidase) [Paraburkholderia bryophila]